MLPLAKRLETVAKSVGFCPTDLARFLKVPRNTLQEWLYLGRNPSAARREQLERRLAWLRTSGISRSMDMPVAFYSPQRRRELVEKLARTCDADLT